MEGVDKAVVGVWRANTFVDESDSTESSPEAPDHFREKRSSSSLNTLRMSLRKRLPLRSVQANAFSENPTQENLKKPKVNPVRKFTRSARNSFTDMYQRFQKTREFSREECLIATPGRDKTNAGASTSCSPRQPTSPRKTPRSKAKPCCSPSFRGQKTPEASVRGVKTGGSRRHLVRMAAMRSPFSSPNVQNQRKFDQDLDTVSSGLRKLKKISRTFDDLIRKEDRKSCGQIMRKVDPSGKLCRSNLSRQASHLSDTVGGWANTAVNTICKPN